MNQRATVAVSPSYQPQQQQQQGTTVNQSLLNTYASGQTVTPVATSFENKNINISPSQQQQQATKITFGTKQFTSQYSPQPIATTNYTQPISQYQTYQNTYQSY